MTNNDYDILLAQFLAVRIALIALMKTHPDKSALRRSLESLSERHIAVATPTALTDRQLALQEAAVAEILRELPP